MIWKIKAQIPKTKSDPEGIGSLGNTHTHTHTHTHTPAHIYIQIRVLKKIQASPVYTKQEHDSIKWGHS